jgi:hypothetical protein
MPGGGMRYVRSASGVDTVIVNGEIVYTGTGGYTDARPGVLATVRSRSGVKVATV